MIAGLRKSRGREGGSQRGAALLEMALIAPVLVVLVLGIVDLGRVLYTKIPLQQAVQEGAIYAGHFPDDYSAIRAQVQDNTNTFTLAAADITVSCPTGASGTDIKVAVDHDVTLFAPIFSQLFGGTITLNADQTAEILGTDSCAASP
jgi:Flp pilus assembly protein TadG